jgi:hypothetical protein
MKRALKVGGAILVGVLLLALLTLRLTGLDPQYMEGEELKAHRDIARPGLWLRGEVVRTPISDWSFISKLEHPGRATNTIMVETRTPYFIPHSVTTAPLVRNGQLYIPSRQGCPIALHGAACEPYNGPHGANRIDLQFPKNKFWTANVMRDPRVRLKIGGKLYEMTLVLIANRAESQAVLGRDPETREKGPDGQDHVIGYTHLFRVYQRNIPEFGGTEP